MSHVVRRGSSGYGIISVNNSISQIHYLGRLPYYSVSLAQVVHGGRRSGAGRPKGAIGKKIQELTDRMEALGCDPTKTCPSLIQPRLGMADGHVGRIQSGGRRCANLGKQCFFLGDDVVGCVRHLSPVVG